VSDHDDWVARGFCPAIYTDDENVEHWCRLPVVHSDPHVAPFDYSFPKSESMVRWEDGPTNVKFTEWKPDPWPILPLS